MKQLFFKVILSKEEMNIVRNAINFTLSHAQISGNKESVGCYEDVKVRFDMEYEREMESQKKLDASR